MRVCVCMSMCYRTGNDDDEGGGSSRCGDDDKGDCSENGSNGVRANTLFG